VGSWRPHELHGGSLGQQVEEAVWLITYWVWYVADGFNAMVFSRDIGKTLKRQVRKTTGMKPSKQESRKQRYMLSGRGSLRGIPALAEESDSRPGSVYGDDPDNWSSMFY